MLEWRFSGFRSRNMTALPLVMTALFIGAFALAALVYIALLSRHRKAGSEAPVLLGMVARVETTLEPEGAIILRGELWRARLRQAACAPLMRGSRVRIVGVSSHLLEVEPTD